MPTTEREGKSKNVTELKKRRRRTEGKREGDGYRENSQGTWVKLAKLFLLFLSVFPRRIFSLTV